MLTIDSLMLRRGPTRVRLGAARRLGESHDPRAIAPLAAALEDHSGRVVEAAADSLVEIGGVRAASALVEHLHGGPPGEAGPTDTALIELGSEAVDPLLRRVSDAGGLDCLHALWLLGEIADRRCVAPLIARLGAGNPAVRRGAAEVLGRIGDDSALQALIMSLGDGDREVRQEVTRALRRIAPRWAGSAAAASSRKVLIGRLADTDPGVRREAALALERIPGRVEPALLAYLADELGRGDATAAHHLARTGDPRAVEPLVAALEGRGPIAVRRAAAHALGALGSAEAIEPLRALFEDGGDEEREIAISALARSEEACPLDLLIEALGDSAAEVRWCAARSLGSRGDRRAAEPLRQALATCDLGDLGAIAQALRELGEPAGLEQRIRKALTLGQWKGIASMGSVAVEPLGRILESPADPLMARVAATELLGRLRDPRAFEVLINALSSSETVISRAAVVALVQMRFRWREIPTTRRVVGRLVQGIAKNLPPQRAFQPESELAKAVRSLCVSIVREMGKGAIGPLSEILGDGSEELATRMMAAAAMGWIGGSDAVNALAAELDADELLLRGVAAAALSNMGTAEAHHALLSAGPIFGESGGGGDYYDGGSGVDFDFDIDF